MFSHVHKGDPPPQGGVQPGAPVGLPPLTCAKRQDFFYVRNLWAILPMILLGFQLGNPPDTGGPLWGDSWPPPTHPGEAPGYFSACGELMGGAPGTFCALLVWGPPWCTLSAHGYPPTTPRRDARTFFSTFRDLWRNTGRTSDVLRAGGPFMGISGAQNGFFLNFLFAPETLPPFSTFSPFFFICSTFRAVWCFWTPWMGIPGAQNGFFLNFFFCAGNFCCNFST